MHARITELASRLEVLMEQQIQLGAEAASRDVTALLEGWRILLRESIAEDRECEIDTNISLIGFMNIGRISTDFRVTFKKRNSPRDPYGDPFTYVICKSADGYTYCPFGGLSCDLTSPAQLIQSIRAH